jgi:hypothetical protein
MSDSQDRSREPVDRFDWLNDDAAERLLLGEAVDARAEPLARLLAAAGTPAAVDPAREEAALAAFRAAGEEVPLVAGRGSRILPRGARRRGDGRRRVARSVRALAGAMAATAALGGVAVAAGALPSPFAGGTARPVPAHSVPGRGRGTTAPGGTYSPAPDPEPTAGGASRGARSPMPPATAHTVDYAELCRAYAAAHGRHERMDDGGYRKLEQAAGDRQAMSGYCARLLDRDRKRGRPDARTESGGGRSPGPAYSGDGQNWYTGAVPSGVGSGSVSGNSQGGGSDGGADEGD